jgi:hypothetical protein
MELSSGPPILPRNDACLNVTKRRTRSGLRRGSIWPDSKANRPRFKVNRLQDGFTLTSYCAAAAMHP